MVELRCPSHKHGVLDHGVVEVKCASRRCGAAPGVVVLHRFDGVTGELVQTLKFRDPSTQE